MPGGQARVKKDTFIPLPVFTGIKETVREQLFDLPFLMNGVAPNTAGEPFDYVDGKPMVREEVRALLNTDSTTPFSRMVPGSL